MNTESHRSRQTQCHIQVASRRTQKGATRSWEAEQARFIWSRRNQSPEFVLFVSRVIVQPDRPTSSTSYPTLHLATSQHCQLSNMLGLRPAIRKAPRIPKWVQTRSVSTLQGAPYIVRPRHLLATSNELTLVSVRIPEYIPR